MASKQERMDARCGYCGKQNSCQCYCTVSMYGDRFFIHHCSNCKAYFLSSLPTVEQFGQSHDDSYYGSADSKFPPFIEAILDFFANHRAVGFSDPSLPRRGSWISAAILTSPVFVLLAAVESAFGAGGTMEMVFQFQRE